MILNKILKHRINKVYELEGKVYDNIKVKENYEIIFKEQKERTDVYLFNCYISLIDKEDAFDLGSALRKIGISKFYDLLKVELVKSDNIYNTLNNIDIDLQNQMITDANDDLEKYRISLKELNNTYEDYPADLITLYTKLFSYGEISSQEDIIDYRLDNKVKSIFSRKHSKIVKLINQYYDIYQNFTLFTDGDNLYDEYQNFLNNQKKIDEKLSEIKEAKEIIIMAESEIHVYNEDVKYIRNEGNINIIKKTVLGKFHQYMKNENMYDYYLEILENHFKNEHLLKLRTISNLKLESFLSYKVIFDHSNEIILNEINTWINDIKIISFASFEDTNLPYFSNVGYFMSDFNSRVEKESYVIKLLSEGTVINSYNLDEIKNNVIYHLLKKGYNGLYTCIEYNVNFSQTELNKYNDENEKIKKSLEAKKPIKQG